MAGKCREALGDHLAVEEDGRVGTERDGDKRQTLDGPGAEGIDSHHAVHCVFDRLGDERLHLFRRQARRFGLNHGLGRSELGEDVVLGERKRIEPIAREYEGQGDDHAAEAERKPDDCVQHVVILVLK